MYHTSVNESLIVENVTRIKNEITINASVSVKIKKIIKRSKKNISGILAHVVTKMVNIYEVLLRIH